MTDHFAEAERLLKGDCGFNTSMAALIHAILAVAQEFAGAGECDCHLGQVEPFRLPIVDADLTGDRL